MPPKSAIAAGHLCLDIIPQIEHLPDGRLDGLLQPGHLFNIGPATICTGGPVSNTGLGLHLLGVPTQLIAKVGADPFGATVKAVFDSYAPGLAEGLKTDPAVGTSYTVIVCPPGIDRIFWHYPAANDAFGPEDVDYALVRRASLFHFGYPTLMRRMCTDGGADLIEVLRRAKAAGVTTSLDMSLPDPTSPGGLADWPAIYRAALPLVDVFAPSIDELLYTLRRAEYDRLLAAPDSLQNHVTPELLHSLSDELIALGVGIVMIKTGVMGAYLRTTDAARLTTMGRGVPADLASWENVELWAPCFDVKVVGTTGSGDATIAGFLAALLRDLPPQAALTAATAVGACNVEAADALGGIRSWEATQARIRAGWLRHRIPFSAPGWGWDEEAQLFIRLT